MTSLLSIFLWIEEEILLCHQNINQFSWCSHHDLFELYKDMGGRFYVIFLVVHQRYYRQKQPPEVFYGKVASVQELLKNAIKKRLQHRCFPINIAKFLRTSILKNICERLLLHTGPSKRLKKWRCQIFSDVGGPTMVGSNVPGEILKK